MTKKVVKYYMRDLSYIVLIEFNGFYEFLFFIFHFSFLSLGC